METMQHDSTVLQAIDSFDLKERLDALIDISGKLEFKAFLPREQFNMHLHSFYSFNANGYSPAHLALECRKNGLYAAGLCDFDVLDGLEEFITAGQILGLRVAVHLETRAFLREYAQIEVNSLGEPGVAYIMGAGFGRLPAPNSDAMAALAAFRQQANVRNRALVERINARLPDIAINYETDVLSLSPGGCPTERHIVRAYRLKAEQSFCSKKSKSAFWSQLLRKAAGPPAKMDSRPAAGTVSNFFANLSHVAMERLIDDPPAMEEKIRTLLVKGGGIGYIRPTEQTFPPVDDFIDWVLDCNAIPMVTWLDGTSRGEADMTAMLECMKTKGAAALNIVPDRNHNIQNADERRLKLGKLNTVIAAARELNFPINIGTEMNKAGQPFVDNLDGEALAPYRPDFLRGANIMVGQTILTRYAGFSYCGKHALDEYGADTACKNNFFESVGKLSPLSINESSRLSKMGKEKAFQCIRDSSAKGKWQL